MYLIAIKHAIRLLMNNGGQIRRISLGVKNQFQGERASPEQWEPR